MAHLYQDGTRRQNAKPSLVAAKELLAVASKNGPPLTRRHTTQILHTRSRSDSRSKRRSSSRHRDASSEKGKTQDSLRRIKSSNGIIGMSQTQHKRGNSARSVTDSLADKSVHNGQLSPSTRSKRRSTFGSRDNSSTEKGTSASNQESLRRIKSTNGMTSLSQTMHRRSNSSSSTDDLANKSGQIWKKYPASVSSASSKPSLFEKLCMVEQSIVSCPLPSLTGESLDTGDKSGDSERTQNNLNGFVQFDPSKSDNINLVRALSEEISIFPMKADSEKQLGKEKGLNRKNTKESGLEGKLKEMDSTSHDDMPPLIDETLPEAEDINSLFGTAWNGAITLTSDNALSHVKDAMDDSKKQSEHGSCSELEDEKIEGDEEDDNDGQASDCSREVSEGTASEIESDREFTAEASPALLQFNYKTPNGLDFAACMNDSTSIFRMDSNGTLDVPAELAAEVSELDKQLTEVDKASGKEKRTNMFTATLKRARSFKKPVEKALQKAESTIRNPSTLLSLSPDPKQLLQPLTNTTNHVHSAIRQEIDESGQIEPGVNDDRKPAAFNGGDRAKNEDAKSDSEGKNYATDGSSHSATKGRRAKQTKSDKSVKDESKVDMDGSNPRRRRERIKGRRESAREKASENIEEDRKERLRKRDAVRKAASSRNMASQSPGRSPKKRPSVGRRRSVDGVDRLGAEGAAIVAADLLELDPISSSNRGERRRASSQEPKEAGTPRRRSSVGKSNSARIVLPARTAAGSSTPTGKKSLRRTSSGDAGAVAAIRRRSSSGNRRRPSERSAERRSHEGADRVSRRRSDKEGERSELDINNRRERHDLDANSRKGKSKERRSSERKRRSRSRKGKHAEEQGGEKERYREPSSGSKERRHGSEKKQARKSRKSRDPERRHGGTVKRSFSLENSPQSVLDICGEDMNRTSMLLGSSMTPLLDGDDGDEKTVNSLRMERSCDSFPDLRAQNVISGTFHNDLGADDSERRKSFIKNLGVRIGAAKQSTIGKGAKRLIIGGSRTEKRRLLAADDESIFS